MEKQKNNWMIEIDYDVLKRLKRKTKSGITYWRVSDFYLYDLKLGDDFEKLMLFSINNSNHEGDLSLSDAKKWIRMLSKIDTDNRYSIRDLYNQFNNFISCVSYSTITHFAKKDGIWHCVKHSGHPNPEHPDYYNDIL